MDMKFVKESAHALLKKIGELDKEPEELDERKRGRRKRTQEPKKEVLKLPEGKFEVWLQCLKSSIDATFVSCIVLPMVMALFSVVTLQPYILQVWLMAKIGTLDCS